VGSLCQKAFTNARKQHAACIHFSAAGIGSAKTTTFCHSNSSYGIDVISATREDLIPQPACHGSIRGNQENCSRTLADLSFLVRGVGTSTVRRIRTPGAESGLQCANGTNTVSIYPCPTGSSEPEPRALDAIQRPTDCTAGRTTGQEVPHRNRNDTPSHFVIDRLNRASSAFLPGPRSFV
jgi:hypothetical protein